MSKLVSNNATCFQYQDPISSKFVLFWQVETKLDKDLHQAAATGSSKLLQKILDTGKVHIDCRDEVSHAIGYFTGFSTPFFLCRKESHLLCWPLQTTDWIVSRFCYKKVLNPTLNLK